MKSTQAELPLIRSISILYRCAQRIMNNELCPYDLNSSEHPFLVTLNREGDGLTQEALARHRGCNKSVVTKAVRSLEKKGYVTRKSDPLDHRKSRIYLTEKTVSLMPAILAAQEKCGRMLFGEFDPNIIGLTRTTLSAAAQKILASPAAALLDFDPES